MARFADESTGEAERERIKVGRAARRAVARRHERARTHAQRDIERERLKQLELVKLIEPVC